MSQQCWLRQACVGLGVDLWLVRGTQSQHLSLRLKSLEPHGLELLALYPCHEQVQKSNQTFQEWREIQPQP